MRPALMRAYFPCTASACTHSREELVQSTEYDAFTMPGVGNAVADVCGLTTLATLYNGDPFMATAIGQQRASLHRAAWSSSPTVYTDCTIPMHCRDGMHPPHDPPKTYTTSGSSLHMQERLRRHTASDGQLAL